MAAPRRGLRFDLQPLSENLADTVELSLGEDSSTSKPTDTTSAESPLALVGNPLPLDILNHRHTGPDC